jgi:hypothetical protein
MCSLVKMQTVDNLQDKEKWKQFTNYKKIEKSWKVIAL